MRKIFFLFTILFITVLLISCEEAFNPQGDFDDKYILNCIIRIDSTFQVATISRSYTTNNGYSTTGNTNDQSVQGAKITLTCSNFLGTEVYQFRDTVIEKSNDTRIKTPIHFYYLKYFNPSITRYEFSPGVYQRYSYSMNIEAVLPDGKKISSFAYGWELNSSSINTYIQNNPVKLQPENLSFQIYSYSQPELLIKYSKYENGTWNDYEKLVPKYYSMNESTEIPVYPIIERLEPYVNYDTLAIRKTLQDLSTNDSNKQNYMIKKIVFMLNVLDGNLTNYFSSQQTFNTSFSYRVTQPDYTNVNGGLGIFGTMYTIKKEVPLTNMIRSLGYRTN
ncbi:MAG: DUF4249 family protein [Ignavibacteriales bacterium]|nr:DUF4249 family protein [Ignavibacteriales bacterium]